MASTKAKVLVALGVAVAFLLGGGVGLFFGLRRDVSEALGETGALPQIDLGRQGTYLAIGDSYSAGEGLPDYDPETDDLPDGDRCHRSLHYAYPMRMRTAFRYDTLIVHRACSGAEIKHVFEVVQMHDGTPNHLGLQIAPPENGTPGTITDDVLLVTITMSGNDLRFADMLIFCAKHASCLDDEFLDTPMTLTAWAEQSLERIGIQLTDLYEELRGAVPSDARVLAVGYPGLFPDHVPSLLSNPLCHEVLKLWGNSEREAIRDWNVRLDGRIQAAADAAGIEYVDVYPYFTQHETCGSAGAWIKFVGDPSPGERDGWFHPTRVGQYILARIVSCHLHVYRSVQEVLARDDADSVEMSNCVSDHYPSVSSSSLPTPCVEVEACRIEDAS